MKIYYLPLFGLISATLTHYYLFITPVPESIISGLPMDIVPGLFFGILISIGLTFNYRNSFSEYTKFVVTSIVASLFAFLSTFFVTISIGKFAIIIGALIGTRIMLAGLNIVAPLDTKSIYIITLVGGLAALVYALFLFPDKFIIPGGSLSGDLDYSQFKILYYVWQPTVALAIAWRLHGNSKRPQSLKNT